MPTYHATQQAARTFAGTDQSWFPAIHRKTFSALPVHPAIQLPVELVTRDI